MTQRNTFYATHSTQHTLRNTARICANMKRNALCNIKQDACIVQHQTRCMMQHHTRFIHGAVSNKMGSLKLQVSFAECSLFYRALLQKRPIILRSLLTVATPYYFCDALRCPFASIFPRRPSLFLSDWTEFLDRADFFKIWNCNLYTKARCV